MRRVRLAILVMTGLITLNVSLPEAGAINFEDGGTHTINGEYNGVEVRDGSSGENTTVIVTSGADILYYLDLYESSKLYMTDGSIHKLFAYQTSSCTISGGEVNLFYAQYSSKATISGGKVNAIYAGDDPYPNPNYVVDNVEITIIGSDFKVSGQSVEPGTYTVLNSPFGGGTLTGTLANGDPFNSSIQIYDNSRIIIIPEPSMLLLLGVGGLVLRRQPKL